jgi:hypothetical protein
VPQAAKTGAAWNFVGGAAVRSGMNTRAVIIGGALALLLLVGCGGTGTQLSASAPPGKTGATAHVELKSTTIAAGSRAQATLVIENHTGHDIDLPCGPFAQLTNAGAPWVSPHGPGPGCSATHFGQGTTRWPFVVAATRPACTPVEAGPTGCAPLVPGDYTLELRLGDIAVRDEPTVRVISQTVKEGVYAHIELGSTTMTAGSTQEATLVIENHTQNNVTGPCGYGAQLTNDKVHWVERPQPACATVIPSGTSRTKFTIAASVPPGDYKVEMHLGPAIDGPDDVTIHVVADGGVKARIELPSDTIKAGTDEQGTLVIENGTGTAVSVSDKNGCALPWDVLLGNDKVHQPLVRTAICSAKKGLIPPGETRWTFRLSGSYVACVTGGSRPGNELPPCGPLPVGDYRAELVGLTGVYAVPVPVHGVAG